MSNFVGVSCVESRTKLSREMKISWLLVLFALLCCALVGMPRMLVVRKITLRYANLVQYSRKTKLLLESNQAVIKENNLQAKHLKIQ